MLNSPLLKPLHEYACALSLFSNFANWIDTALEKILSVPSLAAINKSFLLPIFGLVVSFGSALNKRQTLFSGNTTTHLLCDLRQVI